jgi:RimK family alpha-L-glutamate ligase
MLKSKCAETGIKFLYADPETAVISRKDDKHYVVTDGDNSFDINPNNTIVLPRLTILKNSRTKNFLKEFENRGFFVINNLESYENCENKYTTYKVLSAENIPTPKTTVMTADDMDRLQKKVNVIGNTFPIVCKLLDGKKGIGVFIIDSYMSLKSTLETIFKLVPNAEILMQNKIESDYDLRIHVFNKSYARQSNNKDNFEIIGVMRRNKIDGDFRTNFSLGGTIESFELTEDQKKLAIDTACAVKCKWCGVDMIVDKNTGDNYIIEVNASPGVKGITSVSEVPPIDYIFEFLKKFKYINNDATVIGYKESATLLFGDLKYDTNVSFDLNNDINVIETKSLNYNENSNHVSFVLGNNTITKPVNGTLIESDNVTRSYLIQLNIEFNDNTYKNVIFKVKTVDSDEQHIVLSNSFLGQLGNKVSIDPNTAYLVTDPIE